MSLILEGRLEAGGLQGFKIHCGLLDTDFLNINPMQDVSYF